jgi:hypothetical protein
MLVCIVAVDVRGFTIFPQNRWRYDVVAIVDIRLLQVGPRSTIVRSRRRVAVDVAQVDVDSRLDVLV